MGHRRSAVLHPPTNLAAVRRSLEGIAFRAIRTGRGPDLVVASITRRDCGWAASEPSQQWQFARAIAAELAPDVCRRMAARDESVTARDTVVVAG
jgi:hypothetical protein